MITRSLKKYLDELTQYTELRVQENKTLNMGFLNGNMVSNTKTSNNGVGARVYKNGSWGFASNSEIDDASVKEVLKAASNNALFLNSRLSLDKEFFPKTIGNMEKDFRSNKHPLTQGEIKDYIKTIDNYIAEKYPNLTQRYVGVRGLSMEKSLITSDNSNFYSFVPTTSVVVQLVMMKDGAPVNIYEVFGGAGEIQDQLNNPSDFYEDIDKLYKQLADKSEGVYPKAGLREIILDTNISGILAHEAIGHTTEADLVLGGSIASEYMNKQVASPLVSLVDFAHTYEGKTLTIPIYMDDEGTVAEDVVIIENGILKNYMHNKESARLFNTVPKGNARAWQFSDEPLIRMRNTAILPGESKLEDMIASIEDGYYLTKTSNGQADTTSEFTFAVTMGYEIKNGKLGKAIKDSTISGNAFDVLKSITAISDEMIWAGAGGMCGKKQPIPVGMGGPSIKCKVNIGGE
ncbi:TldD/PmbA family protein [Mycoplasmatota bacterium]|nr:TldD/PmbA family protein [Mycoplasmatota bacterium]